MVALCSPRLLKRRLLSLSRIQALAVALTFGLLLLVMTLRRRSDFVDIDSDSEDPQFYAQDTTHLHGRLGVDEKGHPSWKARRLKVKRCLHCINEVIFYRKKTT